MTRARRIRHWLWNGAVVVSLVMMVGLGVLCAVSYQQMLNISRTHQTTNEIVATEQRTASVRVDGFRIGEGHVWYIRFTGTGPVNSAMSSWATKWDFRALYLNLLFTDPKQFDFVFAGVYYDADALAGFMPDVLMAVVPLYYPLAVTAILPTLWLILHYRNRRKRLPNHCQTCGYNLAGTLAAGRSECPECGATIAEGASTT